MNKNLLQPEVQEFIKENYKQSTKVLFKGSPFEEISPQELGTQLTGKQKAEKKLPTWFNNEQVIYPPTLNLEQTSSEITAEYKASLLSGEKVADLTGGFGIDSFFISKNFEELSYFEINKELSELAAHNFKALGAENIKVFAESGLEYLQNTSKGFDWLYIDPSRRSDIGGRLYFLEDCLPNVPQNLDFLFRKTDNILLKTSPLLDISAGVSALKNVSEIHVVAIKNDVKELLWLLKKDASAAIKIKSINFKKMKNEVFETNMAENASAAIIYSEPQEYLYEPNAAIMKTGMFASLGAFFNLQKLHVNTHLFTSQEKLMDFPGRKFQVQKILPYKKKELKRGIDFDKAHIATRNFPLSVANLRKQLKLGDGGKDYLFFTTTAAEQKIVLFCRKF